MLTIYEVAILCYLRAYQFLVSLFGVL